MQKVSLAAVAICKNEEKDLPGFLQCLLPWVDEIVIVDDGSTDLTLEILSNAGDKVKVFNRRMDNEGGFSAQRNAGIQYATCDWLLHMDIDERVTPDLAKEILAKIQDDKFDALRYRRLNYFLHSPMLYGGWQYWNKPQLARRGFHRFENAIHEECIIHSDNEKIGQLKNCMHHLADDGYIERVNKNIRYMQMSGDEILAKNFKIKWYHLLIQPLYRSFKSYFLQHGWRAGVQGLMLALYTFSGTFNWWAYAWDKQNSISRSKIETSLKDDWEKSKI